MKRSTTVFFVLILIVTSFQTLTAQRSRSAGMPEKYREVSLGFGPRTLSTEPGVISTTFVDNSPSMDNFQGSFDVAESYTRFGFNLGYNWGRYNGLSQKLIIDFATGNNEAGIFNYGIGWNISRIVGDNILTINPGLFVGFGNYGFGIGEIENNAGFIQIGSTMYFDNELDMSLYSQAFIFGPEISIDYDVTDNIRLWINAAYDFSTNNDKPKLRFKGQENTSEISLDEDTSNPLVTYNGNTISSLPYDPSALRASVGVSYYWQRD